MELGLGAVQFGLDYGIANEDGKLSLTEAAAVLDDARSCRVDLLDTAVVYGDSEQTLGDLGTSDFKIVTKVGTPENDMCLKDWLQTEVHGSLRRLKRSQIYGLLLHRPPDTESGAREWGRALEATRDVGLVEKLGVSLYSPEQLELLLGRLPIDVVQLPMNLFDRRFLAEGWLSRLAEMGIEIHVRSVFLQGLLLMQPKHFPALLDQWRTVFSEYHLWLDETAMTPLEACLRFIKSVPEVDRVIVGVTSRHQLREIADAFSRNPVVAPESLAMNDERLLNPSRWTR